jgi:hypothetical protein
MEKPTDLNRLLGGPRLRTGLAGRRRPAVSVRTAFRTYNLGILVGHFVEESGKCLAALVAQRLNRIVTHIRGCHTLTSARRKSTLAPPLYSTKDERSTKQKVTEGNRRMMSDPQGRKKHYFFEVVFLRGRTAAAGLSAFGGLWLWGLPQSGHAATLALCSAISFRNTENA